MNIEKNLILIKGEDKTEDIRHCEYKNGKWQVQFGTGKTYPYNYLNVQWLRDPVSLSGETTVVYLKGQPLGRVEKIFKFRDYIRVCFVTGYNQVYPSSEITIEQSCLINQNANNRFEYLKSLADKVSVIDEEDSSFLSRQYGKITYISPSSVKLQPRLCQQHRFLQVSGGKFKWV